METYTSPLRAQIIEVNWRTPANLELEHPYGDLIAKYEASDSTFVILDYWVANRHQRQGVGTELLKTARAQAIAKGATLITATLTSQESVVVMTKVFGESSVQIERLGGFGQFKLPSHRRQTTVAQLKYNVNPDANDSGVASSDVSD